MTHPSDDASSPDERNRLGRALVARHLGGVAGRGGLGRVAAASMSFARGWGRPAVVRRQLATPLRQATAPATTLPVAAPPVETAPPRWWVPPVQDADELPGRGLRRVVRRMPTEHSPGAASARLAPKTVPMHLPPEVGAVGRMTTPADSRSRRSGPPTRPPSSRPAGGPPGNAGGVGTSTPGAERPAPGPGPGEHSAAAPRGGAGPAVSRLLRRRAVARAAREANARPVLDASSRATTAPGPALASRPASSPTTASSGTVRRSVASDGGGSLPSGTGGAARGDALVGGGRGAGERGIDGARGDGSRTDGSRAQETGVERSRVEGFRAGATGAEGTGAGATGAEGTGSARASSQDAGPSLGARLARPGQTVRPLAGPVRRAVSPMAARSPLRGASARVGSLRAGSDVRAAGISHAPAPPTGGMATVRRSTEAFATPSGGVAAQGPGASPAAARSDASSLTRAAGSGPVAGSSPVVTGSAGPDSGGASVPGSSGLGTTGRYSSPLGTAASSGASASGVGTSGSGTNGIGTSGIGARRAGGGASDSPGSAATPTSGAPALDGARGAEGASGRRGPRSASSLGLGETDGSSRGSLARRQHRLPGAGHRRPGNVRRSVARLGTDAPGLRRLTSAVPHAIGGPRATSAHPAPTSVRPAPGATSTGTANVALAASAATTVRRSLADPASVTTRGTVAPDATTSTTPAALSSTAPDGGAVVRRSTAPASATSAAGPGPRHRASDPGTRAGTSTGTDAASASTAPGTAAPSTTASSTAASSTMAPNGSGSGREGATSVDLRRGALDVATLTGPVAVARRSPLRRRSADAGRPPSGITELADPGAVGAAMRALGPVAVSPAVPVLPARPGQASVPSGPVVRRWESGGPRSGGPARPGLLGHARAAGAPSQAAPGPGSPATTEPAGAPNPPTAGSAHPWTAPAARPTIGAHRAGRTGLPGVRSLSLAPPLAAVGAPPATPGVAGVPAPRGGAVRPAGLPRPAATPSNPMSFSPPPWAAGAPSSDAPHPNRGADVRPHLWTDRADQAANPDVIASEVEHRVVARLEEWIASDLDERVIELVERRMAEETERRAWRLGTEVF